MKRKLFFLLFFISTVGYSQDEIKKLLPSVVPNSPSVNSLGKFGNYIVSYFHGLPNISIPIHNIEVGKMKIPISIDYHASGIKVNDWANSVGTGWSLNAGGQISRILKDKPDESGFIDASRTVENIDLFNQNDYYFLQNVVHGLGSFDGERDIFSYSIFNQLSGSFLLDKKNNLNPILFPLNSIMLNYSYANGQAQFKIIDEIGNTYFFSEIENTYNNASNFTNNAAYKLSKVISFDNVDTIEFVYSQNFGVISRDIVDYTVVEDKIRRIDGNYVCDNQIYQPYTESISTMTEGFTYYCNEKILTEIRFRNGKVVFLPSDDNRIDGAGLQKKLKEIQVFSFYNGIYKLIKKIELNHSYFYNNVNDFQTYRLKLQSIAFKNINDSRFEKFSFDYNELNLPKRNSKSIDYWGYFNNQNNETLVPQRSIEYYGGVDESIPYQRNIGSVNAASREVNPQFSQAGMLTKITYPTGGWTVFEFENNKYLNNGVAKLAGGHRIKSISSYSNSAIISQKEEFVYGTNENGFGRQNFTLDEQFFFTEKNYRLLMSTDVSVRVTGMTKRQRIFSSYPTLGVTPFDGSPVTYSCVTKYNVDGNGRTLGKTIFKYSDKEDDIIYSPTYQSGITQSNHLERGHLISEEIFKGDANNIMTPLKSTLNNYQYLRQAVYNNLSTIYKKDLISDGFSLQRLIYGSGCSSNFYPNVTIEFNEICGDDKYSYSYINVPYRTHATKLVESVQNFYSPNGNLINKNLFSYNNNAFVQLNSKTSFSNKGETIVTTYKYPTDFQSIPIYNEMVSKNMITYPIETKTVNQTTGSILDWRYQNYRDVGNGIIDIKWVDVYDRQKNTFTNEVNYDQYDSKGNLEQLTTKQGVTQSYLYGYSKNYPTAQVVNAKVNEVYHENFEESTNGWTNYSPVLDITKSRTGKGSAKLYNPTISEYVSHVPNWLSVNISTPTKYKYSGWVYSDGPGADLFLFMKYNKNSPSYNDFVTSTTTNNTNKWIYLEGEYTVPAGITAIQLRLDNNGGGNVWFDDLKIYPSTAQVTTYTYEPLVGITSQTDVNNRITYYEYDGFNRLMHIRDQENNILKKYCYNYAGQPIDCKPTNRPNIYAKLSYIYYPPESWGGVYGNVVINFYSNEACTQPLNVTHLALQYNYYFPCYESSNYSLSPLNVVANGTSVTIASNQLLQYMDTRDINGESVEVQCNNVYTILNADTYNIVR